jgi:hypothetical protein
MTKAMRKKKERGGSARAESYDMAGRLWGTAPERAILESELFE